ncbi:MAG: hypothetical protein ACM3MD_03720, partial [Betaproteobacteria bacterium]
MFDKIQKVSPKTRRIAFIVLIIVLLIVYVLQVQIPMHTQIEQLRKSLSELQAKIQQNESRIKKLDELRAEVKTLQEKLLVLTEQLP